MKNFRKNVIKSRNGITLIALVITIIVLLILAGISISMLSGDNSILSKAGEARDMTGEKQVAEDVQLAYLGALAKGEGNVTRPLLENELNNAFGSGNYTLSEDLTKVTIDGKEYDVGGTLAGGSGLTPQADGTYKDSKGNEWVWIEVPKTVTASATTEAQIETALRTYCSDVISTGTSSDSNKTTTAGFTDTWYDGCGLSQSEYTTTKNKMLNSIKDNGGFFIGKYETGIENSYRTSAKGEEYWNNEEDYPATELAVIKQNAYPYNYVTCSQAETLAKGFATDGKTSSLLFGIQWDLVLKFIKVKENLPDNTIFTSDSKGWGNYYNTTYNITNTRAWYSTDYGENWTKGAYNKSLNGATLLTTGADSKFAKQNIYDLAGNVLEWTLEKTSGGDDLCVYRGGDYEDFGVDIPASNRINRSTTLSNTFIGFRVTLY